MNEIIIKTEIEKLDNVVEQQANRILQARDRKIYERAHGILKYLVHGLGPLARVEKRSYFFGYTSNSKGYMENASIPIKVYDSGWIFNDQKSGLRISKPSGAVSIEIKDNDETVYRGHKELWYKVISLYKPGKWEERLSFLTRREVLDDILADNEKRASIAVAALISGRTDRIRENFGL